MPIHDIIAAVIVERPLCLECIAAKSNVALLMTDEALTNIAKVMPIDAVPRSRCRNCGDIRMTYSIGAPQRGPISN
jgi:hypothetical protein